MVSLVTPYSKNRRMVTVIDTDTKGGTRCGLVAMVEVVALMVGGIVSCYSEESYDAPRPCEPGMMLRKGRPQEPVPARQLNCGAVVPAGAGGL